MRDKLIAAVKAREVAGAVTEEQAVASINSIQAQAVPAIQAAASAAKEWAAANAAIFTTPEQQAAFIASIDAVSLKATTATAAFTTLEGVLVNTFTSSALTAVDRIAQAIGGLVNRTMTWREALNSAGNAVGQMFAEVLRGLAMTIIKQQILNTVLAISKALGWSGVAGAAVASGATAVAHGGGMVGSTNRTRNVPSTWFAAAPRYHGGGMPGLGANEYTAILEKNEEVLSKDSPRNVLNGGGLVAAGGQPISIRSVLVDDRSRVPEAMNSPEGERVTLDFVRRNLPTIKQWLGS